MSEEWIFASSYSAILLGCGQRMELNIEGGGLVEDCRVCLETGFGHSSTGMNVSRVRDKHQNRLKVKMPD